MSEFSDLADAIMAELRQLGIMQRGILALSQQLGTILAVATAEDWEDRYVAEGVVALESTANGHTNGHTGEDASPHEDGV